MPATARRVAELLATELSRLRDFSALLREEQLVLQSGKPDDLPAISPRKADAATALAALLAEREAALSDAGLPTGRAGMQQWIATLPETDRAAATAEWTALLSLAEQCRAEHELNGKLIAMQLAQTQQALTALMTAGGQTLTYGPDGQQKIGGGRSLGSA